MYPVKYDFPLTGLGFLEYYPQHQVFHPGVDFNKGHGNDDLGLPIVAPKAGYVEYIHENVLTSGGFGKFVILKHSDGTYTRYAHLATINVIGIDPYIIEGQQIGILGNTGTTYAHLHFEVFNEKMAVIQRKNWKPWRYYPSGKIKEWIQQHYINPWEWLKQPVEKTELEKGYDYLIENGLVKNSKAKDVVTVDMLGIILSRLKNETIKKN